MEQGRHSVFFACSAGVLVLLYLLSSTNLILHEKKVEIYPISVIVEDSSDEDYEKLRKGMDQAAEALHVDLNFITLYEPNDQEQQLQLISREISDGARAVIFSPAAPAKAAPALDEMVLNSPLVVLGNPFPHPQVLCGISIDYMEAGRLLGEAAGELSGDYPIYLITQGLDYGYARELKDGILKALEQQEKRVTLYPLNSEDDCRQLIESTVYPQSQQVILIALDEKSLEEAARVLEESSVYGGQVMGLFGIGGTNRILNYLDKGIIRGLVVHNLFDEGYLSVEKAVEAIQEGGGTRGQITLEAYYITKEALRDSKYEKMLYPID